MEVGFIKQEFRPSMRLAVKGIVKLCIIDAWMIVPLVVVLWIISTIFAPFDPHFNLLFLLSPVSSFIGIFILALICISILLSILNLLSVRAKYYILEDDAVILHHGFVSRTIHTIPINKITDVMLRQGILDRLLGIGTVAIETPGQMYQTRQVQFPPFITGDLVLDGLQDPHTVHDFILKRIKLESK